jgi:hypothetical protein
VIEDSVSTMPSKWMEIMARGIVRIFGQCSLAVVTLWNVHGYLCIEYHLIKQWNLHARMLLYCLSLGSMVGIGTQSHHR